MCGGVGWACDIRVGLKRVLWISVKDVHPSLSFHFPPGRSRTTKRKIVIVVGCMVLKCNSSSSCSSAHDWMINVERKQGLTERTRERIESLLHTERSPERKREEEMSSPESKREEEMSFPESKRERRGDELSREQERERRDDRVVEVETGSAC